VEYFDIVPAAITLNTKLTVGARLLWVVVRRRIQEGDRYDRRDRSRRIKAWELAADLGVSENSVRRWLDELEDQKLIDRVRGSHNGNLIILLGEHRGNGADRPEAGIPF
jgi:DeoR-like helix-turn-helix domain